MNQLSSRCRHLQVNWINTHTCQCFGCHKTGHWFEREGLVIWALDKPIKDLEAQNLSVAENSFSSKAG